MKILGLIGRSDIAETHDGSAALIIDNQIQFALEQERLTRRRYAEGQGCADAAKACLDQAGLQLSDMDYIAYGWLEDLQSATPVSEQVSASNELTSIILPPEQFGYTEPPTIHFVQHHYTHAAVTFLTSGFDSAAVLVMDGQGEGAAVSLFRAEGDTIEMLETYPIVNSVGMFYGAAGARSGLGWHSGPGKLMGLAPFGQVRETIDFHFDPEAGKFILPAPLQKAIDEAPTTPTAADVGMLWMYYFEDYHYPYRQDWQKWQENGTVDAYDVAHYVDFAASAQQTIENIGRNLALRLKKLTGEKNLVLSGGCALNCNMNAMLSREKIFDNLYVFPAANDAGCSIGAALAVSQLFNKPDTPLKRLPSPAFGRSYPEEDIIAALIQYGFKPEKLSSEEIVERVAADLAADKIVAWFRGQDEFGPRALGRRSFLANPCKRETLGRLNKIKGREMWRPLAPSILSEKAEIVLGGDLEPGLHRYMLGVATIRPEWRTKVPAVVHIDFSTRSHLVDKEQDGIYWSVINQFYEKTGIPLVCNTSLNVAGQPLVHQPQEVLEIYTTRDDVQTLVIENFYLTKPEIPEDETETTAT
uniref:Putative carbamoyl transferase n=1 Tax=Prochloron didemni P1-Palau TaxID=910450 RepID=G0XS32_PRODI|nr:putative carbamoyl transferase [Prochloron didemni P1-Palau]